MARPNNFDVLKAMAAANGKIRLAPLSNITNMRKVKAGTQLTMGVEGDVLMQITLGQLVGGLILADKDEFEAMAKSMEVAE